MGYPPPAYTSLRGRRSSAFCREESGFTLIETLVASVMFVIVLTATLALLTLSQRTANSHLSRSDAIAETTAGLQNMDHELRGAYEVVGPTITAGTVSSTKTSNYLDVYVRNNTGTYRVLYDCTLTSPTLTGTRACERFKGLTGAADTIPGGTKGAPVVDHLSNGTVGAPVFTLTYPANETRPDYAVVTVRVPAKGEDATGDKSEIELTDGVYMPNLNLKR
jgi:prepilin-type N-terminal cleavage/methylation domain-containing protein